MIPEPKPGILDISAYVGGRASAPGVAKVHKLSSNESPLGPSPAVLEVLPAASRDLHIYPEGSARLLREAIAEVHGLDPARLVGSGDGSDQLLTMLANAYLKPGDEVLFSRHAFSLYKIATLANSAVPVIVPENGLTFDVDATLARVSPKTKLVYIANPNNPTGTYISDAEMRRLHAGLSRQTLLVIDAAYAEYIHRDDYEPGAALVREFPNVVMTRTFSKIYGLAGMRIGWCFAPAAICDVLNRVRGPFNVSTMQQIVGATAIRDQTHVTRAAAHNEKWRDWLTAEIRKTGLRVDDSFANFVLIHFLPGAKSVREADDFLMKRGLILRACGSYDLPNALRLTVGTEEQNRLVASALADFMAA